MVLGPETSANGVREAIGSEGLLPAIANLRMPNIVRGV